ncbi:MAG: CGNR zinc finger domain-containing protein [Nocardioidaceae bacterium]
MTPTDDTPLRTVVDFLNTVDVEDDTDVMADLGRWRGWVEDHLGLDGSAETAARRDAAVTLRGHLRDIASGATPDAPQAIPVTVDLYPASGVRLSSETAVGRVASAVAQLSIERRWSRVKICPADDCRIAFYDESKNHSRQWCSMRVCGNRAKARAHRERASD